MSVDPMLPGLVADPGSLGAIRRQALGDEPGALRAAAEQFEQLFMDMVMKSMRSTVSGESLFDNEGSRLFTGLLDQEFARGIAEQGGLGLADLLVVQLSQLRGAAGQDRQRAADTSGKAGESR
ncbi:MAG: rod-binding protein [Burkholderiales bacterium]|nr:rod-binding protein [Burkholderiales bacterium]